MTILLQRKLAQTIICFSEYYEWKTRSQKGQTDDTTELGTP